MYVFLIREYPRVSQVFSARGKRISYLEIVILNALQRWVLVVSSLSEWGQILPLLAWECGGEERALSFQANVRIKERKTRRKGFMFSKSMKS